MKLYDTSFSKLWVDVEHEGEGACVLGCVRGLVGLPTVPAASEGNVPIPFQVLENFENLTTDSSSDCQYT
jgi:hypothetical protein